MHGPKDLSTVPGARAHPTAAWFSRIRSDHREAEKVRVERRMEAGRSRALCDVTFSLFLCIRPIKMKLAATIDKKKKKKSET